ncbi:MAG TPA: DUF4286 family protein [Gemmatimonadales bacterium]|jgi:hypothetical protein
MIAYEVTSVVEESLAGRFEQYMRETHIPDVLATGCFQSAVFARSSPGRYRTGYIARTQADLDRYLETHTARLRVDFAAHFPKGVSLAREIWVAVQRWEGQARID